MKSVTFTVPLIPTKQRPRFNRKTQTVYTPRRTRGQEDAFAIYARNARTTFSGPVSVTLTFCSNRVRGDGDNCEKAVLDSLQKAGMLEDDRQVRQCHWRFMFGESEETRVTVEALP